jgi:CubicO group peptidase (beta-lactamase class C family)
MNEEAQQLAEFVAERAGGLGVPGVAVGVWAGGQETYVGHGITSIDNPLPVNRDTMFVVGSISKTLTATAVMCLIAEDRVDLEAPARRYVPEFALSDAEAADRITVLQLLNHTAGFATRLGTDTGEGDRALEDHVAALAESELISPPGARVYYSHIGFNLLGRVIEKVTGQTFEHAVESLLLGPLGLSHSAYALNDVMTRRFAVGHNAAADGTLAVEGETKHLWIDSEGRLRRAPEAPQAAFAAFLGKQ